MTFIDSIYVYMYIRNQDEIKLRRGVVLQMFDLCFFDGLVGMLSVKASNEISLLFLEISR
jgi:hypothetical protein